VFLHDVGPTAGLGGEVGHLLSPGGGGHRLPERSVKLDRSLGAIEIGDGAKQHSLPGPGGPLQGDAFAILQVERHGDVQALETPDRQHGVKACVATDRESAWRSLPALPAGKDAPS
jgi:hypothetical protein